MSDMKKAREKSKNTDVKTKKATKEEGVLTSINSAAILDILERYSGHMKDGKIVKLRVKASSSSMDNSLGIMELLKSQYGISLNSKAIRQNLTGLVSYIDKVKCDEDEEDDTDRNTSYHVEQYWIEKTNVLNSGEYKILRSKIEADSSLNVSEKSSLIGKIDSIASSDYSKELGTLDNTPTFDKATLGDANISKKVDTIGKAIRSGTKIKFYNNIFDINKKLCKSGGEITFSPYQITDVRGYTYVIGLKEGDFNVSHYRIDKLSEVKLSRSSIDGREKNKNINRYKESHPFMSNSQTPIKAIMKLSANTAEGDDNIGTVIDAFGYSLVFREVPGTEEGVNNGYKVELTATEDAVYKFALMNSDIVEILEPMSLRKRLRKMSKYSTDIYLSTPEDFYEAEIDKIKDSGMRITINREFHCADIDLSRRNEYHSIPIIRLCLDNNNVDDISFVRNYKDLCSFRTRRNPISDYTPLCDVDTIQAMQIMDSSLDSYDFLKNCKSLRKLTLSNNKVNDKSALYTPLYLDYLVLTREDEIEIDRFKEANPLTKVLVGWDKIDDKEHFIAPVYPINRNFTDAYPYPLNIFVEFAPLSTRRTVDCTEADKAMISDPEVLSGLESVFDSFGERDAHIFRSIVKDGRTIVEVAKALGMRIQDVIDVFSRCKKALARKDSRKFFKDTYEKYYRPLLEKRPKSTAASEKRKGVASLLTEIGLKERRKRYD